MANAYFKFKEFTIYQDKCAMKVGTDGVLLGAWTQVSNASYILDIGTGTGLLALMIAQRSDAIIDAIEVDRDAFEQAGYNFKISSWKERISAYHMSLQEFTKKIKMKYDVIVCNPPFFSNAFHSTEYQRNLARHTISLSLSELITSFGKLLKQNGSASLILPAGDENEFREQILKHKLHINRLTYVKPNSLKKPNRMLIEVSYNEIEYFPDELVIEEKRRHDYTSHYKNLTKDFYLAF